MFSKLDTVLPVYMCAVIYFSKVLTMNEQNDAKDVFQLFCPIDIYRNTVSVQLTSFKAHLGIRRFSEATFYYYFRCYFRRLLSYFSAFQLY